MNQFSPASTPGVAPRITGYRWVICALIFAMITINYVDRMAFGVIAPELKKIFHWSNADYTNIAFWFEIGYAIGLAFVGRFLDRVGTRIGIAVALAGWCIAAMLHAGMATIAGFCLARFLLGLTESGAFPGATKSTAEWFPSRERALVAGIFNSGSNVGAILAPFAVPLLFKYYGWQWAFIVTGGIGLVWLVFWLRIYRMPAEHPRVSPAELAFIQSDPADSITEIMPWGRILRTRQAWAFIMGKFFTDAIWRWNIYLLPLFFSQHFNLKIMDFGPPFLIIYLMADVGSIGGGWLSSTLLKRGWSLNSARKTAMLTCVLGVMPIVMVTQVGNMWLAIFFVGLAMASHQGWSSNLYTSVSDLFPKHAIATVAGIGGTAGAIGAMMLLKLTAVLFDAKGADLNTDSVYTTLFLIAGIAYLAALACFHLLVPKFEPVRKL
ncbi:MAG TPA: MFS transporter [Chthoniobacteraceae bacterium]|jgi:ACS family hexuronate transporter-like MFS transporter